MALQDFNLYAHSYCMYVYSVYAYSVYAYAWEMKCKFYVEFLKM